MKRIQCKCYKNMRMKMMMKNVISITEQKELIMNFYTIVHLIAQKTSKYLYRNW
jgi:hypothetical protein